MSSPEEWSGPAASIWAMVCGLPPEKRRRYRLVILNGFVDDSYDEHAFVLAGYVAPVEEWASFSKDWQAALDAKPSIEYLKMSEAMVRPTGQFYGWTKEARDEKLRLLYSIIDKYVSFEVSAAIPKAIYATEFARHLHKVARNPYYLACYGLIIDLARHQMKIGMPEKVNFVFDDQVMEKGKVLDVWDRILREAPPDVKPMLGDVPAFKSDTGDQAVLPLQAADFEAWWLRRRWLEKLTGIPRLEYPWTPEPIPGAHCEWTAEKLKEALAGTGIYNMSTATSARFG
jgi:hypothetical protein